MSAISLAIQETGVSEKAPDGMLYDDILHNITGANELRQHTSAYVSIRQHMTTSYITSQVQTNSDLMGKAMTSKDEQIAYLQVLSLLPLLVHKYKY